nr:MAG TPA: hypothetical protein [Bacteriophage sp.]
MRIEMELLLMARLYRKLLLTKMDFLHVKFIFILYGITKKATI